MSKTIKAYKYKILVDNDAVHTWSGHIINEICIPIENGLYVFVNSAHGAFISTDYDFRVLNNANAKDKTEIELKNKDVKKLILIAKTRNSDNAFIDRILKIALIK